MNVFTKFKLEIFDLDQIGGLTYSMTSQSLEPWLHELHTHNHIHDAHFCANPFQTLPFKPSLHSRLHEWRMLNVKPQYYKYVKKLFTLCVLRSVCVHVCHMSITGSHSWGLYCSCGRRAYDLLNLDKTKTTVWVQRFPLYDLTLCETALWHLEILLQEESWSMGGDWTDCPKV